MSRTAYIPARIAIAGLYLSLLGCQSESPTSSPSYAEAAPVDVPLFQVLEDFNPCTGEAITLTYSGTARIQEFDDHFMLRARGSVVTSDAYTGTFNWTFIFHGDRVGHIRAHDMELGDATGQRMIFPVGVEHVTAVDGEVTVSFIHFSKDRVRCVGKPLS